MDAQTDKTDRGVPLKIAMAALLAFVSGTVVRCEAEKGVSQSGGDNDRRFPRIGSG
jgi:hypothetical protein